MPDLAPPASALLRRLDDWKDHALSRALGALPTPACTRLGALAGEVSFRLRHAPKIERAARALRHLRPDLPEAERLALARANLLQHARTLAEYGRLHRLWAEGRITVEGRHNLDIGGRPLLVAGLHLGNWEVIGPALCGLGLGVTGVYQPPRGQAQHEIITAARRRYGAEPIFPTVHAARQMLRVLKQAQVPLLLYLDEFQNGRVNAPALGRPPARGGNIQLALRLAAMSGAALVPAYVLREAGPRFRVHFLPALPVAGDLVAEQAALEAVIEPVVRRHLDQWLMLYAFRADR